MLRLNIITTFSYSFCFGILASNATEGAPQEPSQPELPPEWRWVSRPPATETAAKRQSARQHGCASTGEHLIGHAGYWRSRTRDTETHPWAPEPRKRGLSAGDGTAFWGPHVSETASKCKTHRIPKPVIINWEARVFPSVGEMNQGAFTRCADISLRMRTATGCPGGAALSRGRALILRLSSLHLASIPRRRRIPNSGW